MAANFPDGFLWGTATAAHQVEGGNTSSDLWLMEMMEDSLFAEPSGDACDHYHLYPRDIALLKQLGFNTYRFSIEWARIEPEEGFLLQRGARPLPPHDRVLPVGRHRADGDLPSLHRAAVVHARRRLGEREIGRPLRALLRARGRGARRHHRLRLHHQRSQHPDHGDDDARGRRRRGRRRQAREGACRSRAAVRRRTRPVRALSLRRRARGDAEPDRRAPQGL